ncbi:MAG: helix-turn-helix domain-containing protein [Clostridiales bacterium]|nr:helix-turn-helix domain-containing protein [Clostridiales bacterium]
MKISMWMMYDAIVPYVSRHNLGDASAECRIIGVLPYLPVQSISGDHIYIISADEAQKIQNQDDIFLIIYDELSDAPIKLDCQYISLKPEISFRQAIIIVLEAIEKYNQWYEQLRQELTGIPDLTRICNIGYELLGNPILLFGPDHALVASSDVNLDFESTFLEKKSGSTLILSDSAYKTIVSRPEHEDDQETGRVSFIPNPLGIGNVLYTNIICRQLEYRLCVNDTNHSFTPGNHQLCKILSDTLQTAMQMDHSRESTAKADLCGFFRDLLENRAVENQACDSILSAWNWKRRDTYVCLCIEKTNQNLQFVSNDQYICSKIDELLADSCSFMHDSRLACIVHLSSELTLSEIPSKLDSFLRDNIFTVGISDEFSDAALASHYYREACIAIKAGRTDHPSRLFHHFSDHSFSHLFQYGFDSLPPICYCERNVRRLIGMHDSRVDYLETLRTYIENDRNLLRTSELLHIHRTTLFYRLNKIKEELDADLDDPDVRLRIWISFMLLDIGKNTGTDSNA